MLHTTISVLVPVYNVEHYIHKCLDSILKQTYQDWEAILVDDGSTDKSGAICDIYAKKDARFVVVHKKNEGVAKARITAFKHSSGELITFIDSDDYVSPDYLGRLLKPVLEDGADMVSSSFFSVEKGILRESCARLTGVRKNNEIKEFIANHYFYDKKVGGYGMSPYLWGKMIKRMYVEEGLNNGKGMWFGEDQIAMFTILYRIQILSIIPDRIYYYVHHDGQATKRYDITLWDSLVKMLVSYQLLDSLHIATEGLRIRTWLYIWRTIQTKMIISGINRSTFVEHLNHVMNNSYIDDFFKPYYLKIGVKHLFFYEILRFRCFNFLYYISKIINKLVY